jgi:thiol:disulfide interchange protein
MKIRHLLGILSICFFACEETSKRSIAQTTGPAKTSSADIRNQLKAQISPGKLKDKPLKAKAVSVQSKPKKATRGKPVKWDSKIKWVTWEEGRALSASEGKSLFLVIYTNWCPRCRELGPVFRDAAVEALSKNMIMVRQNQDESPDWLQAYAERGRYIPRILFFGIDGQLRSELTSGNQKFPYFYTQRSTTVLAANMKKATGK